MSLMYQFIVLAFLPHAVIGLKYTAEHGACNPGVGTWVRNPDPEHNPPISYKLREKAGTALKHFKPSQTQPFPEFMLWDWVPSGGCPLMKMTHASFCAVMAKHKLTHYTIVGDSVNFLMAQSAWKLLEQEGEVKQNRLPRTKNFDRTRGVLTDKAEVSGFQGQILCEHGDITFSYYRNDYIDDGARTAPLRSTRSGDILNPWWDDYAEHASTTLLIANTGLHHHDLNIYQRVVNNFCEKMSSIKNATVIFRESVPGHANCTNNTKPFKSKTDFTLSSLYQWNLVPDFNAYVKKKVEAMRLEGINIMMLDVFEMSILRPDGHRPPQDCLHYYLPGPPDYWNHLLITELLTTAK